MTAGTCQLARAVVYAGIAAGIIATIGQIILWWVFGDALPSILFRDARLTAAIVLGRSVLPPPATFDLKVIFVSTAIHFALSISYTLILAGFISRRDTLLSVLVGILYGVVLFVINMYGFTIIFPWFEQVRDWITFLTHAVFGLSAAAFYKALATPHSGLHPGETP